MSFINRTIEFDPRLPHPKATANQSLFISDINRDCLEHIFKHLTTQDLLNLANTSKLMKMVAESIIERKIKNKWVFLCNLNSFENYYKPRARPYYEEDMLIIKPVKTCLRFLRCFGHLILKVNCSVHEHIFRLTLKHPDRVKALVYEYVFKYCANLVEIEIRIRDMIVLRKLWNCKWNQNWKPMANVEKVYFKGCFLDTQMISFNEIFPKLRSLDFINLRECRSRLNQPELTNWSCIAEPFNNLQHLSVNIASHGVSGFKEEDVLTAIKLNPKLRSLSLAWGYSVVRTASKGEILPGFFPSLCEIAQFLETLELGFWDFSRLSQIQGRKIHFKCLKYLELHVDWNGPFPSKIPFTSDALECITLRSNCLSNELLGFIINNPEITNVFFMKASSKNEECIRNYYEDITNVGSNSCTLKLTADQAILLVNKCKLVNSFKFAVTVYSEYIRFKQLMENSWNIKYSDDFGYLWVNCQKLV